MLSSNVYPLAEVVTAAALFIVTSQLNYTSIFQDVDDVSNSTIYIGRENGRGIGNRIESLKKAWKDVSDPDPFV